MSCDGWDDKLIPYLDAELSEPERRGLEAHLLGCPDCRAEMTALGRLEDLLRRAPPPAAAVGIAAPVLDAALARARAGAARRSRLRAAAAIAACALALGGASLLMIPGNDQPPPAAPPSAPPERVADARRGAPLAERVVRLLAEYGAAPAARRDAIARALDAEGEDALRHVVHALDSPSLAIQVAATHLLGRYRNRRLRELILDYAEQHGLLGSPSPASADLLAEPLPVSASLAMLDSDGASHEAAIDALRETYERFRLAPGEVDTLRRLGYARPAALPPDAQLIVDSLHKRLRSPDLKHRLSAIEAAAALRAEALVPELVSCLGMEGAREAAHAALRKITRQDLPLDSGAWEAWLKGRTREGGAKEQNK